MKTAISAALHEAASRGDHKTITALLADGADLHARDDDGWTPLHIAAWKGHRKAIVTLLDARADLHARSNNGWHPLHGCNSETDSSRRPFARKRHHVIRNRHFPTVGS